MSAKEILNQIPDMLISPNVIVTADVKFHRLLRIEGTMEGKVIASQEACLVLCHGACFRGHLKGLGLVYINGVVEGDISVYRLSLGPQAVVKGNILCQQIEMINGAQINGKLNISPQTEIPSEEDSELVPDDSI